MTIIACQAVFLGDHFDRLIMSEVIDLPHRITWWKDFSYSGRSKHSKISFDHLNHFSHLQSTRAIILQ